MKLTVLTNTFNEAGRVAATCRSFLAAGADEVVVCADGTTDGSCDHLPPGTKVVRHASPQGCGKAKLSATAAASGDVLMWVDAHQNVVSGDLRVLARTALSSGDILCPALRNICYDEQWEPRCVPGSDRLFYPNDDAILPDSTRQYRFSPAPTGRMVGVGLCMSRATYDRVGGWNRFLGRHGSQERGMALRAYMANVTVVQDDTVVLGHEFFGKDHPSRNSNTGHYRFNNIVQPMVNVWHSYMTTLTPRGFESQIQPWLLQLPKGGSGRAALTCPEALADREYYLRHCKQRSDDDLLALVEELKSARQETGANEEVVHA